MRLRLLVIAALLLAMPALSHPGPRGSIDQGGSGGGLVGSDSQRVLLFVADTSYSVGGRDESWASIYPMSALSGGFARRWNGFAGSMSGKPLSGEVRIAGVFSTGNMFGPGALLDVPTYVASHPEITDVVMLVGHSDYIQTNCSHGSPFNATAAGSGICTVAETIVNIEYVMQALHDRGVNSFWQVPPGWLGHFEYDAAAATYQDAIEDVIDALITFCSGKLCHAGAEVYKAACAGNASAPDPTNASDCASNNNDVDYGDGGGLVNRSNEILFFNEDDIDYGRIASVRLHPSGWGWSELFRALMGGLLAQDSTIAQRHGLFLNAFGFHVDWSLRPGVPGLTIGTTTATTIQVTPTRGLYVDGNSVGGTDGKCGYYGECQYACWATCADTDQTSTDPSCSADPEEAFDRGYGSVNGRAHTLDGGSNNNNAPGNTITLRDGETGTLRSLATATEYYVVCVAVSPTAVSHPAIRNVTTP